MRNDRCENCRFFEAGHSECHRYPPPFGATEAGEFTCVRPEDWCGEYASIQEAAGRDWKLFT